MSSSTPVATVTAERNLTFTSTVKSVETSSSGAVSTTAVAGQSLHPQVPRPVTSTTTVTQTTTTTTTKTKNKKSSQQLRPQSETITTVTTSGSKADDEEPLLSASKSDPTAGTPQ
ncbi:hypothetical protein HK105_200488 [Polyrhizophydium stewartii]|uniref:Uncharacterized protein n=1 Tax=Polyrhizophydium stewartii TaxID=2732419 RepID=A0ABR4NJE3_9FUNG